MNYILTPLLWFGYLWPLFLALGLVNPVFVVLSVVSVSVGVGAETLMEDKW